MIYAVNRKLRGPILTQTIKSVLHAHLKFFILSKEMQKTNVSNKTKNQFLHKKRWSLFLCFAEIAVALIFHLSAFIDSERKRDRTKFYFI